MPTDAGVLTVFQLACPAGRNVMALPSDIFATKPPSLSGSTERGVRPLYAFSTKSRAVESGSSEGGMLRGTPSLVASPGKTPAGATAPAIVPGGGASAGRGAPGGFMGGGSTGGGSMICAMPVPPTPDITASLLAT